MFKVCMLSLEQDIPSYIHHICLQEEEEESFYIHVPSPIGISDEFQSAQVLLNANTLVYTSQHHAGPCVHKSDTYQMQPHYQTTGGVPYVSPRRQGTQTPNDANDVTCYIGTLQL